MRRSLCIALVTLIGHVPVSAAQAVLSGGALQQSCRAAAGESSPSGEPSACQAFLQGFFAGSGDISHEQERLSPFKERALKTRVANRAMVMEKLPGRWCLPSQFSLQEMAEAVVSVEVEADSSAADVVRGVLESEYRCPW